MQISNNRKTRHKIWIVFILSFSLLFVQGMQIHVHTYTHDASTLGHIHHDYVHSEFELTQPSHADEVAEIDLSHSARLSHLLTTAFLVIFISVFMTLLTSRLVIRASRYEFFKKIYVPWSAQLKPPLRAPPL